MIGRIRKSFGPLSSGTRCEIVSHDFTTHDAVVRVGPFSKAFYEQNHPIVKEILSRGGLVNVPLELIELSHAE